MRHDFIRLKVKEAMIKRNVKNVDIAKILGKSEGYASSILTGKATATEDRWRVVCSALDINLDAIIDADLAHRLPGIQTVHAAWESLLAGESYEPCEILTEEAPSQAPAEAPCPPDSGPKDAPVTEAETPQEPERAEEPPVMEAKIIQRKIFVALDEEQIIMLLDAMTGMLQSALPDTPKALKNAENIRLLNRVTGLMLRLSEAV